MKSRFIAPFLVAALWQSPVCVCVRGQVSIPSLSGYTFTSYAAPSEVSGQHLQLLGINDANQFLGITYPFGNGNAVRSFLYSGGTPVEIAIPGYDATAVHGINNAGQIVGSVSSSSVPQGFVYQSGGYLILGSPSGESNFGASAISNNGLIVGGSHSAGSYDRVFTYSGGNFTPVTVPGFNFAYGSGVNTAGDVLGFYYSNNSGAGGRFYGFLQDTSGLTTLDIPGDVSINPQGINDAGVIVGTFNFNTGGTEHVSGFVFDGSSYYEVRYPGAPETWVSSVNNNGMITGFYQATEGGIFLGFTATPVPEPSTYAAAFGTVALIGAALHKRRRALGSTSSS